MDTLEAIHTRRSIRKYSGKSISQETLMKLLQAGMQAPSAGNAQPWHFLVISDKSILRQIPSFHPYAKMLLHAPVAILVCADTMLERYRGFWVQDCSAATMSILLAAHALGLGAVWLGIHPIEEREKGIIQLFNLPLTIKPLSLIALGHPGELIPVANRFKESRIHINKW